MQDLTLKCVRTVLFVNLKNWKWVIPNENNVRREEEGKKQKNREQY